MKLDWEELARKVGALEEDGTSEAGGDAFASRALEIILGDAFFQEAVDHYLAQKGGSELARSVLWNLHPWSGMQYCHRLYKTSPDSEIRRLAVELLRVVADGRALKWVPEFLADADEEVQNWGIGVLDQLLFSHLVEADRAWPVVSRALEHSNPYVRGRAESLKAMLEDEAAEEDSEEKDLLI